MDLSDGSWVIGAPATDGVDVHMSYGDAHVKWPAVSNIKWSPGGEARLSMANSDHMTGRVTQETLDLATSFGPVTVPMKHATELTVVRGGEARPENPPAKAPPAGKAAAVGPAVKTPPPPSPEAKAARKAGPALALSLADGSTSSAVRRSAQINVKTEHGNIGLKWEQISGISWKAGEDVGNLVLHNHDTLTGRVTLEKIGLDTLLGAVVIPLSEVRQLTVMANGGGGRFSLRFDGKQNYVEVPNDPTLDPLEAMTLECWYKTEATHTMDMLGKRRWRPNGFDTGYEFNVNEGRLEGYWSNALLLGSKKVNDGTWHHAALTWDGHVQRLFDDGHLVSQSNPAPWTPAGTTFRIGGVNGSESGVSCFTGSICQVRLSKVDRYRGQDFKPELQFGIDKDTEALWDFSEGGGDAVHDRSGHGHDGKFVGSPAPEWANDIPTETPEPKNPVPEAPRERRTLILSAEEEDHSAYDSF